MAADLKYVELSARKLLKYLDLTKLLLKNQLYLLEPLKQFKLF